MTGRQPGGPARIERSRAFQLLGEPRSISLCFECSSGELDTTPAWVVEASLDTLELVLPAGIELGQTEPVRCCAVADRFESYAGIEGVIVRGTLAVLEPGCSTRRLGIATVHGFSFENTTTSGSAAT